MSVDESIFPRINEFGYQLTSDPDEFYNCIAWAAGVADEWWDPYGVWPDDVPQDYSVDSLIQMYTRHGFSCCDNGDEDTGYEKIAIYANGDIYEHAARRLDDGQWTSKLGPDDDISHPRPESLEGDFYGYVVKFMKRSKTT